MPPSTTETTEASYETEPLHGMDSLFPSLVSLSRDYEETRLWEVAGFSGRPVRLVRVHGIPDAQRLTVFEKVHDAEGQWRWTRRRHNLEPSEVIAYVQDLDTRLDAAEVVERPPFHVAIYDAGYLVLEFLRGGRYRVMELRYDDPMSEEAEALWDFVMGASLRNDCAEVEQAGRRDGTELAPLRGLRYPAGDPQVRGAKKERP